MRLGGRRTGPDIERPLRGGRGAELPEAEERVHVTGIVVLRVCEPVGLRVYTAYTHRRSDSLFGCEWSVVTHALLCLLGVRSPYANGSVGGGHSRSRSDPCVSGSPTPNGQRAAEKKAVQRQRKGASCSSSRVKWHFWSVHRTDVPERSVFSLLFFSIFQTSEKSVHDLHLISSDCGTLCLVGETF